VEAFENYLSPFSWRYGSKVMRELWSEVHKLRTWRRLWVALAQVEHETGMVSAAQLESLRQHADEIDIQRTHEIEAEIHHDVMAEIRCYGEQALEGAGIIHLGATSSDVKDNALVMVQLEALEVLKTKLLELLNALADQIDLWADLPVVGFTHLQPAEPTTLGYRLAVYAQDLMMDWNQLCAVQAGLKGKGFKGAVGTGASFIEVLGEEHVALFDRRLSELLGFSFFPITTQTYTRKQDYRVLSALAGLGASLHKMAFDVRVLQSPVIFDLSEPFGSKQVGSSAMPFKKNPIKAEKMDSLARLLAQYPRVAWDNAAMSLLERTLDDSANMRTALPEAFLVSDELLATALKIISGMVVHEEQIGRNFAKFAPFASVEKVLMAIAKKGGSRQEFHEVLRGHSLKAWDVMLTGGANPLQEWISADTKVQEYLTVDELAEMFDPSTYLGWAPQRARQMAAEIRGNVE
jgi:adenylosuccinate lyase